MRIKINGQELEIFDGARVEDVLRLYSRTAWEQAAAGLRRVTDRDGHEVALDGELGDGEELIVGPVPAGEDGP